MTHARKTHDIMRLDNGAVGQQKGAWSRSQAPEAQHLPPYFTRSKSGDSSYMPLNSRRSQSMRLSWGTHSQHSAEHHASKAHEGPQASSKGVSGEGLHWGHCPSMSKGTLKGGGGGRGRSTGPTRSD
jgi:hypothetical protein